MKNSTKKNEKSDFTNIMIDLEQFKKFINFDANHGVCGSINLGNTCYMNSSIACLSNCSELTAYFLLKEYIKDINYDNIDGTQGNLAKEWFNLLNSYWNSTQTEGDPKKIKKIIGSKNKKFKGYNQQDSNEFMTVFLEILCEDLNRTSKKKYIELLEQQNEESDMDAAYRFWELHIQRNDSIVTDLFHGLFKSTIICPRCDFKSITYNPFNILTLTIPDIRIINKRHKNSRIKVRKRKEKERVNIYYVPPFSLKQTKKIEIEVYKGMTLDEIMQEIVKRNKTLKIKSKNLKFVSVLNKECEKFLEPKMPNRKEDFIFAYEKETKDDFYYSIPIYLCDNEKLSAYPRILFINKNTSYNDFKKKIYFLVRKFLRNPFYDENNDEEFVNDEDLSNYIEGISNYKLKQITSSFEKEFELLKGNFQNKKDYKKNPPYKIYIKKELNNSNSNEFKINEGVYDNMGLLSNSGIKTDEDIIDTLLNNILKSKEKMYLMVKINNKSNFVKKDVKFDDCKAEDFLPMTKEEETKVEKEEDYISQITLDHCLEYFTEEECLEEGNEWYCNNCEKKVMASKQIELFYLPRIMIICLTRFLKEGKFSHYTKNNSLVEFPIENLNMEKYICGPKKNSQYDLFAVSQHYGSMGGGHYTAVCKNIDGNWYKYDDENCSPTSVKDICTEAAYVLFYRRQSW